MINKKVKKQNNHLPIKPACAFINRYTAPGKRKQTRICCYTNAPKNCSDATKFNFLRDSSTAIWPRRYFKEIFKEMNAQPR